MLKPGLYTGPVMHQRLRPRRHRFAYRSLWLLLDLDRLPKASLLFAVNRFSLFSFHERDHADGAREGLRNRIAALAKAHGVASEGRVLLLTMPRILGHAFNPLSIYFCFDPAGELTGIVWEVTSTFRERHSYVLPVSPSQGGTIRQRCAKVLHVSPFLGMELEYRFRVACADESLSVGIADCDGQGVVMAAALRASWSPLSDGRLLAALAGAAAYPFKTLLAIHWEALRLALRGLPIFRHDPRLDHAIQAHSATSA